MKYAVERFKEELRALNQTVWEAAEPRFEEYRSMEAESAVLKKYGFAVEEGIAGLPTAYRAVYGSGTPAIGLLAEYDALDGLSQEAGCLEKKPRLGVRCGHGCGHNLLGTAVIAAALDLKEYLDAHPGAGSVVVYGCPAEEGGSGKTLMAGAGVFHELDAALAWHPATINASMGCSMLANCQAHFKFHGISSHAGNAPEKGRSALDAVELMNVGINFLREHMEMTDRVHYAVTNTGGVAPNVVQAEAEVIQLVRSRTNAGVKELYERVCDIARGAALMTDTTVEIVFDKACSNVVPNKILGELAYETMVKLGPPEYTKEEQEYVKRYHELVGKEAVLNDDGAVPHYDMDKRRELVKTHPMADFILPYKMIQMPATGSSDIGDVSQIVPLVQFETACFTQGAQPHSWLWVTQGLSSYAEKGMLFAGQVMAEAAKRLLEDHARLKAAKEEQQERMGGQPYVCPIPEKCRKAGVHGV
ncbi:MAG: amidohydrolase [Lachnospiraceae bacterium]|nr:amidohydrolase [Lachnospiraceae bacterium]